MLPLKIMVVLWSPLFIFQDSFYYLIIILTQHISWRNISLTVTGWKECTAIGNMMKNIPQKIRFYWSPSSDKDMKRYFCLGFSRSNWETSNCFVEHQHYMDHRFSWLVCLSLFYSLLYLSNSFVCLFYSCYIDHSLLQ